MLILAVDLQDEIVWDLLSKMFLVGPAVPWGITRQLGAQWRGGSGSASELSTWDVSEFRPCLQLNFSFVMMN